MEAKHPNFIIFGCSSCCTALFHSTTPHGVPISFPVLQTAPTALTASIVKLIIEAANYNLQMFAAQNAYNETTTKPPPVLTPLVAKISIKALCKATNQYHTLLQGLFTNSDIGSISKDLVSANKTADEEPKLLSTLTIYGTEQMSFRDFCFLINYFFLVLRESCSSLSSVDLNIVVVESIFSTIGLGGNESLNFLPDRSLECILHCKQWQVLQLLSASRWLKNGTETEVLIIIETIFYDMRKLGYF